jgi:hypothetical protein
MSLCYIWNFPHLRGIYYVSLHPDVVLPCLYHYTTKRRAGCSRGTVVSMLIFGRCSRQTPIRTPTNMAEVSVHTLVGALSPVRLITASHSLTGTNAPAAYGPEMYHSASSTCNRGSSPSDSALHSYPWGTRFVFRPGHRLTEALRGFPRSLKANLGILPRLDYNGSLPNNF